MISYVAQVLNLFATAVQNTIHIASLIGKLIIIGVTWISSVILRAIDSVIVFFQIVYEDNTTIFTEEIPDWVSAVVASVLEQLNYLWNTLATAYCTTYYKLSVIVTVISRSIDATVLVTCEVLLLLKKSIIFLGDSLWFIITFIPVHLPLLLKVVFRYIKDTIVNTIVEGYTALLALTNFLTEVPLESFVGLMSAIIIVRLGVHFRERIQSQIISLYWSLVRNVLYLYYVFYNYLINSEVRVISRMANGEEVGARDVDLRSDDVDDAINQADSLCVICQERQKCVLTLPCRHVCLCTECCRRLYGYQRTCPICRTFIYHSVTVYL